MPLPSAQRRQQLQRLIDAGADLVIGHHPHVPQGWEQYAGRFATVEPVFGNVRHNKKLSRFTLRGRKKVDTQWKLFCLVHNVEKLANNRYAQ